MDTKRLAGATLAVAIAALIVAVASLGYTLGSRASGGQPGMMGGGYAQMMGGQGGSMMGGQGGSMMGGQGWWANPSAATLPGGASFVPGTASAPRTIRITAGPGDIFSPSSISVQRGETVSFVVTTMGPVEHEFMVGSADAVGADRDGTPEIPSIGMMQTKSLTFTFDGAGPYAYACHEAGHYEAGMRGTITVVG